MHDFWIFVSLYTSIYISTSLYISCATFGYSFLYIHLYTSTYTLHIYIYHARLLDICFFIYISIYRSTSLYISYLPPSQSENSYWSAWLIDIIILWHYFISIYTSIYIATTLYIYRTYRPANQRTAIGIICFQITCLYVKCS